MIVPVENVGAVGIVTDRPFNALPLNAWTSGRNVRFRNGAVEKFSGETAVLTSQTPVCAPHWLLHTAESGLALWLYAGLQKVGGTDGTSHADLTRATGGYNTTNIGWTGTIIEGIPVINNGVDVPQMWNRPALGTKLTNLSAWPGALRANALRGLKRYLIALDCTISGIRHPTMVKWSHEAPTGDVPQSWNELDHTKDAGEYTLPGDGGYLIDGVTLRDTMILYREYQTWRMDYVGGVDIFTFNRLFDNVGLLHRRCGVEFRSGHHLVFTGDDIVVHDGSQAQSILTEKARGLLQQIDDANAHKSFVVANYLASEVWICVPEQGNSLATLAIVWNWQTGTLGARSLPDASHILHGIVNEGPSGNDTWDAAVGVWDTDTALWGDRVSDPSKRRLVISSPADEQTPATWRFFMPEITHQFNGFPIEVFLERLGLGFPTVSGGPPDYHRRKQVLGIWPKIQGSPGGRINVTLGTQERLDSPVNWSQPRTYTIGESDYLDFSDTEASKLHALRFESDEAIAWKLDGYDVEVVDRGGR